MKLYQVTTDPGGGALTTCRAAFDSVVGRAALVGADGYGRNGGMCPACGPTARPDAPTRSFMSTFSRHAEGKHEGPRHFDR